MSVGRSLLFLVFVINGAFCQRVKISTFYESLCPDSQAFIVNQLQPTYAKLRDIIDVELVAYGKATDNRTENGYEFECQHGPEECYGNMVLTCAKRYIMDQEQFMQFTFCIMADDYPQKAGEKCAERVGVSYFNIEICTNSTEGEILLHEEGFVQNTQASNLNYVPWIIINDRWTKENLDAAQENLEALICSAYRGPVNNLCFGETNTYEIIQSHAAARSARLFFVSLMALVISITV